MIPKLLASLSEIQIFYDSITLKPEHEGVKTGARRQAIKALMRMTSPIWKVSRLANLLRNLTLEFRLVLCKPGDKTKMIDNR